MQKHQRGHYIYFLLFFSFTKIPYIKTENNFVLSYEQPIFYIYYIINQIIKHCTLFAQKRTICTFLYKNAFCTQNKKMY